MSKLKEMEESQKDAEDNFEKLSKLYQLGVIDDNGEYRIRRCPVPLNDRHFAKLGGGLKKGDFYFS